MTTTPQRRQALITGGGTGIGLAIATRLAADGCDVHLVGRRTDVLEQAAASLAHSPGLVTTTTADCADPAAVAALASTAPSRLDVLVLNAGGATASTGDDLDATAHDWLADFRLNVLTAVLPAQALVPRLSRPGGRLIAIGSVAGLRGSGSYGAMKGALHTWVTGLAGQLAGDGITVNAVAPGFVPDTGFWDGRRGDDFVRSRAAGIPVGRAGTPAEVAALVAHLAAPEAGFTTGQVIGVHGGTVLARL